MRHQGVHEEQLAVVPLGIRVEAAQDPCTQGEGGHVCVSVV